MKSKRLITLVLTIALLLSTLVLLTQAADFTAEPTRDVRSVISEELLDLLECRARQRSRIADNLQTVEQPMEDTLPISVWLTGIDEDAVEAAANVIAVGNLDTSSGSAEAGHTLRFTSCYIDDSKHANKPDLVAPGTSIYTSSFLNAMAPAHGTVSEWSITGTSFAAPIVTGIVAQVLEQNPGLKTQQDTVKAILTCAVNHSKIQYTSASAEFEKYGAGCVDARSSGYVARMNQYKGGKFLANAAVGSTQEYTFTIKSTDDMKRISLTWLKSSAIVGSHTTTSPTYNEGAVARLKLEILNSSGTTIATAYSDSGNLEILQLNNPTAGTYKIRVTLESNSTKQVNFAVAWW